MLKRSSNEQNQNDEDSAAERFMRKYAHVSTDNIPLSADQIFLNDMNAKIEAFTQQLNASNNLYEQNELNDKIALCYKLIMKRIDDSYHRVQKILHDQMHKKYIPHKF